MPCGHVISPESMTKFLDSLIDNRRNIIRCPGEKPDGKLCEVEWPFKLCKKVGILTKEEILEFETKYGNLTASLEFNV